MPGTDTFQGAYLLDMSQLDKKSEKTPPLRPEWGHLSNSIYEIDVSVEVLSVADLSFKG